MDIKIGDKFEVFVAPVLDFSGSKYSTFEIEIVGLYRKPTKVNGAKSSQNSHIKDHFIKNFSLTAQFVYKSYFDWMINELPAKELLELIQNTEDYKSNPRFPLLFNANFKKESYYDN